MHVNIVAFYYISLYPLYRVGYVFVITAKVSIFRLCCLPAGNLHVKLGLRKQTRKDSAIHVRRKYALAQETLLHKLEGRGFDFRWRNSGFFIELILLAELNFEKGEPCIFPGA
jgi:hypothetical protein